jgi:hypothetical protein
MRDMVLPAVAQQLQLRYTPVCMQCVTHTFSLGHHYKTARTPLLCCCMHAAGFKLSSLRTTR